MQREKCEKCACAQCSSCKQTKQKQKRAPDASKENTLLARAFLTLFERARCLLYSDATF